MSSTPSDPSMARLAPQPSSRRNLFLALAGAAVLSIAAFSPLVLRPSVVSSNGASAGSWHALPISRQVLTFTTLDPAGWPAFDIRSVDDVSGAQVNQAWVVDESAVEPMNDTVDATALDDGVEYVRAAFPNVDVVRDAVPRRIGWGEPAILIVLWDIDSCDGLAPEPARVLLRTVFRTSRTEALPDIAGPGFDVDTLRSSGTCG